MSFGSTLKDLLKEHNISQAALAQSIGYTQRAISKWINEQAEPSESAIVNTAKFFGISTDYLLGNSDNFASNSMSALPSSTSNRESELLNLYRQMNTAQQNRFLGIAEGMIDEKNKLKNNR